MALIWQRDPPKPGNVYLTKLSAEPKKPRRRHPAAGNTRWRINSDYRRGSVPTAILGTCLTNRYGTDKARLTEIIRATNIPLVVDGPSSSPDMVGAAGHASRADGTGCKRGCDRS